MKTKSFLIMYIVVVVGMMAFAVNASSKTMHRIAAPADMHVLDLEGERGPPR